MLLSYYLTFLPYNLRLYIIWVRPVWLNRGKYSSILLHFHYYIFHDSFTGLYPTTGPLQPQQPSVRPPADKFPHACSVCMQIDDEGSYPTTHCCSDGYGVFTTSCGWRAAVTIERTQNVLPYSMYVIRCHQPSIIFAQWMIGGNLYIGNNKIYIHNTALKWELYQATKLLTQFLLFK